MNSFVKKIVLASPAMFLSACMVGPDFKKPESGLPDEWSREISGASLTEEENFATLTSADLADWWKIFNDPVLTSLVERSFKGNLTIADARAKIAQARATLGITQSGLFPSLDANAAMGESAAPMSGVSHASYGIGASTSWELDIFGGTRRSIESAVADYRAALAEKCAAQVAVSAEVAENYFLYRGYQQELIIVKKNLETQKNTYRVTQMKKNNGFVSDLDVVRAAASVESTSSEIPSLESKIEQTRNALELLLGLPAGALAKELEKPRSLPELERYIPAGVPAKLVERRPDIIVAEHKLHAAVAKIGNAEADWYPKFSITGNISYQAPSVGNIIQNQYGTWSVGPNATWNIFQAGKTVFNVELQEALTEAAGVSWKLAVLTAFKEVEDALVASAKERERIAYINRLVENNRKAFSLSSKLYEEGQIEFLDLLDTQRSMLTSEQSQVNSRRLFISYVISLYKSLGGGWGEPDMADTQPEKTRWLFFKDSFKD